MRFGHGPESYQNIVAPLFTYYKISAVSSTSLFLMISMFLIPFKSNSKPLKSVVMRVLTGKFHECDLKMLKTVRKI